MSEQPPCPYCGGESNAIAVLCRLCGGHLQIGSWPAIRIALLRDATLSGSDAPSKLRLENAVNLIDVENPLIGQFSPRRRTLNGQVPASGFELEEWYATGLTYFQNGDAKGAEKWFSKAAESGDARAALNMAVMADDAGDKYRARTWYEKAWQLGLPSGARGVACIHLDFDEFDAAREWLEAAAGSGDYPAVDMLNSLMAKVDGSGMYVAGATVKSTESAEGKLATPLEVIFCGMRLSAKLGLPKEAGQLRVTSSQAIYEPKRTNSKGLQVNQGVSNITLNRTSNFEVLVGVLGNRGSFTGNEKYQINIAALNLDQGLDSLIKIQIDPRAMTMVEIRMALEELINSGVPVSINQKPVPQSAIRVSGWGIGFGIGF